MEKQPVVFNYEIVESQDFCVISFVGHFASRFSEQYEECTQKILASTCTNFVLNFSEVTFIERTTHRFLVQLQKQIKDEKKAMLKLCSLKTLQRTELIDYGIIKNADYANDLKSALMALKKESDIPK